jgi:hypothetical protein
MLAHEEDLQTTSDAILAETDRLETLEGRKRTLGPDDDERVQLSVEIANIGRRLAQATAAESQLAREAADR